MSLEKYRTKYRPKWQSFKGLTVSWFFSTIGFLIALPSGIVLAEKISDLVPLVVYSGTTILIAESSNLIFSGLSLIFGLFALSKGSKLRSRIRRFNRYHHLLEGQERYAIGDIATAVGKPVNFVTKDLQKMIGDELFLDAYVDKATGQILIGKQNYMPIIQGSGKHETAFANSHSEADEVTLVITEGRKQLNEIRQISTSLNDAVISSKIERISDICDKIFAYIAQNPKKLPEIHRFLGYYFPTVLKLLKAYQKFLAQNINGENLSSAITSIENILDTIVTAFEKLLDNLFGDEVLDINTDITVLENILTQEGLTGQDFKL